LDGQPLFASLFGLSACRVYPAPVVTYRAVVSYTAISPLLSCLSGIFSVALSVNKAFRLCPPPVRRYIALCCSDFPLPLVVLQPSAAMKRLALCKGNKILGVISAKAQFLISKFLISKFLISKFLISKFLIKNTYK